MSPLLASSLSRCLALCLLTVKTVSVLRTLIQTLLLSYIVFLPIHHHARTLPLRVETDQLNLPAIAHLCTQLYTCKCRLLTGNTSYPLILPFRRSLGHREGGRSIQDSNGDPLGTMLNLASLQKVAFQVRVQKKWQAESESLCTCDARHFGRTSCSFMSNTIFYTAYRTSSSSASGPSGR